MNFLEIFRNFGSVSLQNQVTKRLIFFETLR